MSDSTIYGILSATTAITDIVGTRISPVADDTPGLTEDRLVYSQISGARDYDADGQGLARLRYRIVAWSSTHAGADALCEAVRAALSGYQSDNVQMIAIEGQGDVPEWEPDPSARQYGKYLEIVMIASE